LKKFHFISLTVFVCLFSFISAQPVITSFNPLSGPIGTSVTITGNNFNPIPSNNIVFFGTAMATVSGASVNTLTVTVPHGATHMPISVTDLTTNLTAYSNQSFLTTLICTGAINTTSFAPKIDSLIGSPTCIISGDWDLDGKQDIAVNNKFANSVAIYKNTSTGNNISFASKIELTTGLEPVKIATGDIDGDGKLDLVVAINGSNVLSIYLNTSSSGNISFTPNVDFITGTRPYSVAINDIDGDGKSELIVSNNFNGTGGNSVSVFRNTSTLGNPSFDPKIDFITGNSPYCVATGDLDNDGKSDISVANYHSNSISIFKNTSLTGSISFLPKQDFIAGTYPSSISIGDLNMDGKLDLAVTNTGTATVFAYKNTSTTGIISFASAIGFPTLNSPMSVSIGDIDGDGKPDLVIANGGFGGKMSVLKNLSTSSINLAAKVDYICGTNSQSVSICDLNGDTKQDVICANFNSNSISVFKSFIGAPKMTSISNVTICSGNNLNLPFTSDSPALYSWIANDNPNITGENITTQVSDTLNDFLINNSTSVQTLNYTVTPTSTVGCGEGPSQTVMINVNPLPSMTSVDIASICSGCYVNIPLTSTTTSSYNWIAADNSNTVGESLTLKTTSTLKDTITNSLPSLQNVIYTVTPTSACGTGTPQTVIVTIGSLDTSSSPASALNSSLIGLLPRGGAENLGTFITTNTSGENLISNDFFKTAIPGSPIGNIVEDLNGNVYGVTSIGTGGDRVLYKYNPVSNIGEIIRRFEAPGDSLGHGLCFTLIYSNGDILCKTGYGGANNKGVLFSYNVASGTLHKIIDCSSSLLSSSWTSITKNANGRYYGLRSLTSGYSNFFELDLSSTPTYSEPLTFLEQTFLLSDSNLVYMIKGGEVGSYNVNTQVYTTLLTFPATTVYGTGIRSVCWGSNGNIYIVTANQSKLLEFNIASNSLAIKLDFDGYSPHYGMACSHSGIVYISDQDAYLHEYNINTGSFLTDTLDYSQRTIMGISYNSTISRVLCIGNFGPLMKLDTLNHRVNNIYFIGKNNGEYSSGGFIIGPNGKYYAITKYGGGYDFGAVIEYDNSNDTLVSKTIISGPSYADLAYTSGGDFYFCNGTGFSKYNCYTNTFDIQTPTWTGYAPHNTPSYHPNGNLYGVVENGGTGNGYIYEYNPLTNVTTNIHNFTGSGGKHPDCELTLAPDGYYYGFTKDGGGSFFTANRGVFFKFDANVPGSFSVVEDLDNSSTFNNPYGKFLSVGNTDLYGVCNNKLFRFNTLNTTIYLLYDFLSDTTKGYDPSGQLILSPNGRIYGLARGGTFHKGVLFEYNLTTSIYSKKQDFDGTNGSIPSISMSPGYPNWHLSDINCSLISSPTLNLSGIIDRCVGSSLTLQPSNVILNASNYAWYKNGTELSGANINLLEFTNIAITDTGSYFLKVTNSCGISAYSDTVTITLNCSVWPGDADNNSIVNNNDLLPIGIHYAQTGSPRISINNTWQGYISANWGLNQANGQDIKHVDCNGDGIIDSNDTLAVNLNFSMAHALPVPHEVTQSRRTIPPLHFITSSNYYNPGDWVDVEIWLGDPLTLVTSLYGIAFSIGYDVNLIQSGTETLTYPTSWLGTPGTDVISLAKIDPLAATSYGAITRIDHNNRNGMGKIANFRFQIKTTISGTNTLNLSILNYMANDSIGTLQTFNLNSDSIFINHSTTFIPESSAKTNLNIYPNPYSGNTQISYSINSSADVSLEVYDAYGQRVELIHNARQASGEYRYFFSAKEKGLGSGVYFVKLMIDNEIFIRKIIELK
jgi:hypothetical protein